MSAINTMECVGITRRHQIAQEKDMGKAVKLLSRMGSPSCLLAGIDKRWGRKN